jgi:HEAT repeat protein
MRTQEAYDALIEVLGSKADVQTCDGVHPVRGLAVEALGRSGYSKAIGPLRTYMASSPRQVLSSGATGCAAQLEDTRQAEKAVRAIEARAGK